MLRGVIFDFDGVICESVEAKTEAFRKLFEGYPELIEQITAYHMENGGLSRFEKFKVIYRDILKKPLTEEESARLGQKFTEYSYQLVLQSPFVTGAYEFLEKNFTKFKLFVASGTPEEEMRTIVQLRGLGHFFKGVYGSPKTKFEIITQIMKTHSLAQKDILFVGDSVTDYKGAEEAKIRFVGRLHPLYPNPFSGFKIEKEIPDLLELEEIINSLR